MLSHSFYRLARAYADTFSAADAFGTVRGLVDLDVHVAFLPIERESVEDSVNGAKRAEIFAEWAVDQDGEKNDDA